MVSNGNAQRRPGHQPRRHVEVLVHPVRDDLRSTKAGASTPATPGSGLCRPAKPSLNEGRGINPGDTSKSMMPSRERLRSTKAGASTPATRILRSPASAQQPRSTKAGASTPATPWSACGMVSFSISAQRRPGHQPRRHAHDAAITLRHRARSTKAGASTPATRASIRPAALRAGALNEGRGINPGDTSHSERQRVALDPRRSTKAGASTPATRRKSHRRALRDPRAGTPATCAR